MKNSRKKKALKKGSSMVANKSRRIIPFHLFSVDDRKGPSSWIVHLERY